ncbi:primosomal protein N' [Orientia chuto str. Dubai]|uniref:Replication restart protein PriA n=1 Tax=Orientia chuto str. Dubai TaxID=1359168 RepID=A0A0F3MP39_9RICK|nr:primosomal protein N' [Candidatus Orientia mediorientalis]KJV57510.1 primosomal protein N' [Orientia chuto str. Dubai]
MFIRVLLPKLKLFPLEYKSTTCLLHIGDLVVVPFRNKQITGIVWEINIIPQCKNIKEIIAKLFQIENVRLSNLKFINIAARYYMVDLGTVAKMVLPVELNEKPYVAQLQDINYSLFQMSNLSLEQQLAFDTIRKTTGTILLQGITGSGKTEIYFHLIAEVLRQKAQVLLLMPEINLASHIALRFADRFKFNAAMWNSSISKASKKKILRGILTNKIKVVIGTRSSLFLPYSSLGLIIVDEEHDQSYKQENNIMYNARDMAVMRGHIANIPVILASATPSLESIYNTYNKKYRLIKLKSRFGDATLPHINIIDMRKEHLQTGMWLSNSLKNAMMQTLKQNKQILLFLNRKGYAPIILCRNCGFRFTCTSCSSCLVFHKSKNILQCHHCGIFKVFTSYCLECKKQTLSAYGPGIERIAEEVKTYFPKYRIAVVSRDTATDDSTNILQKIVNSEVDIIIGTQMLTKGYHFPNLNLVGIIDADLGYGGDLRANEKTYQLLNQVAGRSGREEVKGHVYIQTYYPDSALLNYLINYKDEDFINYEMNLRINNNMPPVTKFVAISVISTLEQNAQSVAESIVKTAQPCQHLRILGPAPALLYKLKNKYRFRILLIFNRQLNIHSYIKDWNILSLHSKTVSLKIDIDPYNFF